MQLQKSNAELSGKVNQSEELLKNNENSKLLLVFASTLLLWNLAAVHIYAGVSILQC